MKSFNKVWLIDNNSENSFFAWRFLPPTSFSRITDSENHIKLHVGRELKNDEESWLHRRDRSNRRPWISRGFVFLRKCRYRAQVEIFVPQMLVKVYYEGTGTTICDRLSSPLWRGSFFLKVFCFFHFSSRKSVARTTVSLFF